MRMTEIEAAIGLVQLRRLEQFTEKRISNAHFLTEHLKGVVQTPLARPGHHHVYHQYTIRVPGDRDRWVAELYTRGISTGIHYPLPIYQQPFYRNSPALFRISPPESTADTQYEMSDVYLPETENAAAQVLSLPVHPALSKDDLSRIVREVVALCN